MIDLEEIEQMVFELHTALVDSNVVFEDVGSKAVDALIELAIYIDNGIKGNIREA